LKEVDGVGRLEAPRQPGPAGGEKKDEPAEKGSPRESVPPSSSYLTIDANLKGLIDRLKKGEQTPLLLVADHAGKTVPRALGRLGVAAPERERPCYCCTVLGLSGRRGPRSCRIWNHTTK